MELPETDNLVEEQESGRPMIPEGPQHSFIFFAGSKPVQVDGAFEAVILHLQAAREREDTFVVFKSSDARIAVDPHQVVSVRDRL